MKKIRLNTFFNWYFGIDTDFLQTFSSEWVKNNHFDFYYPDMGVNLFKVWTAEEFAGFILSLYFLGQEQSWTGEFSLSRSGIVEINVQIICPNKKTLKFSLPVFPHQNLKFIEG